MERFSGNETNLAHQIFAITSEPLGMKYPSWMSSCVTRWGTPTGMRHQNRKVVVQTQVSYRWGQRHSNEGLLLRERLHMAGMDGPRRWEAYRCQWQHQFLLEPSLQPRDVVPLPKRMSILQIRSRKKIRVLWYQCNGIDPLYQRHLKEG